MFFRNTSRDQRQTGPYSTHNDNAGYHATATRSGTGSDQATYQMIEMFDLEKSQVEAGPGGRSDGATLDYFESLHPDRQKRGSPASRPVLRTVLSHRLVVHLLRSEHLSVGREHTA